MLARSVWNRVQLNLVGIALVKTKIRRKPEITFRGPFYSFPLIELQTGMVIAVENYRVAFSTIFWQLLTELDGQSHTLTFVSY